MTSEDDCFICQTSAKDRTTSLDNLAVAVPFRNPAFPGHVVVATTAHRDVDDTVDAEWAAIGQVTRQVTATMRDNHPEIEKCYLVAIGDVDRGPLHFHVLPKRKGDLSLGPFVFGELGWMSKKASDQGRG